MYLKDLTLRGFKSFASTTKFQFEPGITCIVGPNGSGKSNVVDALTWVMGEQGAKSLRGSNMADVIFAGGADRPALGRAQVLLTIDNSDGLLPIPYAEVTISRTMFRQGGSEYAINGQTVRLLDVQELLSDTGMGRQMHVVVGQGSLDSVLSATPVERRAFIDEAAGVAKHRKRKERALSKLASMDKNLVRVLDLTAELKKGLGPLARAAKAAQQAKGTRLRLAYANARLLADDAEVAGRRLATEGARLKELRGQASSTRAESERLRGELLALRSQENLFASKAQEAQEVHRDFTALADRFAAIGEVAAERARASGHFVVSVSEAALAQAWEAEKQVAREAQEAAEAANTAAQTHTDFASTRKAAEAAVREAQTALSVAEHDHQLLVDSYRRSAQEVSRRTQNVEQMGAQVEAASKRLAEAEARLLALGGDTDSAGAASKAHGADDGARGARAGEAGPDIDGAGDPLVEERSTRFEEATTRESVAQEALTAAQEEEGAASRELSALEAQVRTLQRSIDARRLEGTSSKKGGAARAPSGKQGRVADHLVVVPGWEEAVEALLGPALQAWLVGDWEDLEALAKDLPDNLDAVTAGSTGYVSAATEREEATPAGDVESGSGVRAAASVVQGRGGAGRAVRRLLENKWVAENSEEALRGVEGLPAGALVATKGGALVGHASILFKGGPQESTLVLQAEVERASARLAATRGRLVDAKFAVKTGRENLVEARKQRDLALAALREADAERAARQKELARQAALESAARAEVRRLKDQVEAARAASADAEERLAKAEAALPEEEPPTESEDQALAAKALETARADLEAAWSKENDLRMDSHVAGERAKALQRQAAAFRTQAQSLKQDRERQLVRAQKAEQTGKALSHIGREVDRAIGEARAAAKEAADVRDTFKSWREQAGAKTRQAERALSHTEQKASTSSEQLLQTEVAYTQAQAARDALAQTAAQLVGEHGDLLWHGVEDEERANWSPDQALQEVLSAYGTYGPWAVPVLVEDEDGTEKIEPSGDFEPYSRKVAQEERGIAERKLNRLGVVNPLAVQEYEAAKERYNYLEEQVADINESKAHLLELVDDIDQQVKEAFESAFADTAHQFEETFADLFPGGVGRLELTDPDNPLETGVEIYARPAGKRVTRLSLLSGGERSLAALAYLIAIFRARPSPFYVMDEVEAALDDVNLTRVLELFEQLRQTSQLLVVTHQKRTMEAADALYGVSMKRGVSEVISHRMEGEPEI